MKYCGSVTDQLVNKEIKPVAHRMIVSNLDTCGLLGLQAQPTSPLQACNGRIPRTHISNNLWSTQNTNLLFDSGIAPDGSPESPDVCPWWQNLNVWIEQGSSMHALCMYYEMLWENDMVGSMGMWCKLLYEYFVDSKMEINEHRKNFIFLWVCLNLCFWLANH